MQNRRSGTALYLLPICKKRLHLCSHSLLWPPNEHLATCWPLCRPVCCTHSWPVGGCGRLPLDGSSVPHKLIYICRWAPTTRKVSGTDQPGQQHTHPAQLGRISRKGLVSPWTSCQRHVAHHIVQGSLQVHPCWTSPKSPLKGHWSFFWYLDHALAGFPPTALFISDPNRTSPVGQTCWTG